MSQLSLTAPESKLMKMNEGFGVCYNTQTAVDTGSHLIAGFEVTDSPTDHGQITNLAKEVKKDFQEFSKENNREREGEVLESIADKIPAPTKM